MTSDTPATITMVAEESVNLDTIVYRGTAPLADLAVISRADVYDEETNPKGLQRDLSRKHAREAYEYATREPDAKLPRAFPEVLLNVRDKKVVKVEPITTVEDVQLVRMTFDAASIQTSRSVKVSRVDGNHRLLYGNGDGADVAPAQVTVPFSITLGLSREQEASVFLDVNANQKGLNSAHLQSLRSRLTAEEFEVIYHPERAFAMRLAHDEASPFRGLVYMGGSKRGAREKGVKHPLTFTALISATRRLMKSDAVQEITDPDARYNLMRGYWVAVRETWPAAFEAPNDYLLTKSIGVNSMAQFGVKVLDRAWAQGATTPADLKRQLAAVADVIDWHKDAAQRGVQGMNGNAAVLQIAGRLTAKLPKVGRSAE